MTHPEEPTTRGEAQTGVRVLALKAGATQPRARTGCGRPPGAGTSLAGRTPADTLASNSAPQNREKVHGCSEPPRSLSFTRAALGREQSEQALLNGGPSAPRIVRGGPDES